MTSIFKRLDTERYRYVEDQDLRAPLATSANFSTALLNSLSFALSILFTTLPFCKTTNVGIEVTMYSFARLSCLSTSIFANSNFGWPYASRENIGAIWRHGPHQVVLKSRMAKG